MTPIESKELFAKVKKALRNKLDENDFPFVRGVTEQSFPEQCRELDLWDNLTAEVLFRAEGRRHIDRGDYYTPPCESGEITVGITHVIVWNDEWDVIDEHKVLYPYNEENSFTIKY